jgi:proteasome lid subunit RPN8/RPN11
MNDTKEMTFVAIITINLPNEDSATKLRIKLMPSDTMITQSGTLKPLQDCTLGELSQFADSLEAEVLRRYESSTLVDMTLDGQVDISFDYLGDDHDQIPPSELWLEQIVVLPEIDLSSVERDVEESDVGFQPLIDTDEGRPDGSIDDSKEDSHEVDKPESDTYDPSSLLYEDLTEEKARETQIPDKEVEQKTVEAIAVEEDIDAEPLVSVAEPEPVHKEREADQVEDAAEAVETIERIKVRILGRRRPLDHPTWTAVDILINEPAFRDAQAHALTSLDREVAGILVGPPPEKQPDGRYVVHVSDTIIAKHTRMHGASVTYTPESWRYVNDKLAKMYPNDDAVIVGWYHTHPGFGIFLSGMDQFIHQNFFTQIWHIAFVLDPLAHRSGFFCWDRQQSRVDTYEFPWPDWAPGSW